MTEGRAVLTGTIVVNVPVLFLLVGPIYILLAFIPEPGMSGLVTFISGFVLAWLWWSITVPKWRLWAYERVDNIRELKVKAIEAGLIWPDGSFFSRTEIKTSAHAAKEKEYEKMHNE